MERHPPNGSRWTDEQPPVFLVCLREPYSSTNHREDPYWEVGSFGCTRCHASNLFNPKRRHIPEGARLAFSQGGPQGARLVFVTPPVHMVRREDCWEAKWSAQMPIKYGSAPLLIDAQGHTDCPQLKDFISTSKSELWRHKLSSKFRSKAHPLPPQVATQLVSAFDKAYSRASRANPPLLAKTYLEAIPPWPAWERWSMEHKPFTQVKRKQAYHDKYSAPSGKGPSCRPRTCRPRISIP